ncbi:MAG: hypothetical protein ACETWM_01900 [Candidatus Lokiarchaeia archaeon]
MVHARFTFATLKPEASVDEARKVWRDGITPAGKDQKGFVGNLLLLNEETREGMAISLWESESAADAGEKSGYYQEQVLKFAPLIDVEKIETKRYNILETTIKF